MRSLQKLEHNSGLKKTHIQIKCRGLIQDIFDGNLSAYSASKSEANIFFLSKLFLKLR